MICVDPPAKVEVGKLGRFKFSGLYAYTGSAIGKGSTSLNGRVARHLSNMKKIRWHIDYLLSHPNAKIIGIITSLTRTKSKECKVSGKIIGSARFASIKRFGSSDCICKSHLAHLETSLENAFQVISDAHREAGLKPRIPQRWNSNRILLLKKNKRYLGQRIVV